MNRIEALQLLGFDKSASPSEKEINKSFKKKAAKLHPDVNQSETADEDFKKINEAKSFLLNPPEGIPSIDVSQGNIDDFFRDMGFNNPFVQPRGPRRKRRPSVYIPPNIQKQLKLTFKEAVLGCSKDVLVDRYDLCHACEGEGGFETHDLCSKCEGKGTQVAQRGHTTFVMDCSECRGAGKLFDKCQECAGKGAKTQQTKLTVRIPGGIKTGNTVRLMGGGNIIPTSLGKRGNLLVLVDVEPAKNMTIDGKNVISTIELDLVDALKGTTKKVKTVQGESMLIIGARSKNKDEVKLIGYGVEGKGDHVFILDVKYPDDVSKIIDTLEGKE